MSREAPPSSGRQRMHDRRAAALQERLSEPGARLPTDGEIAAQVRRARESGGELTVEQAAMDAGLVLAWCKEAW